MKFILKTAVLAAVISIVCFRPSVPESYGAGSTTISKETAQAVSELEKLGVPLQKDPKGVVRWIESREGELTDKALSLLPKLPNLEWLEIGNGIISPNGMKNLGKCSSLKRLYIYDIILKGESLEWISGLPRLEALSLQRTQIDGTFLKYIKAKETLKVLNLSGNGITDDDMDAIAQLESLEVLALADTQITGDGIRKLEGNRKLNEFNISNCAVRDYDLTSFLSMPNLRIVYAEGCGISDMAIGNIIAQFPMLAIFR
ncbi:MAG: hypothetical protein P8Z37_13060 [Acidobacteriota bacterium]